MALLQHSRFWLGDHRDHQSDDDKKHMYTSVQAERLANDLTGSVLTHHRKEDMKDFSAEDQSIHFEKGPDHAGSFSRI